MPTPHVQETQAHGIAGGAALLLTLLGAVVGLGLLIGGGVASGSLGATLVVVGIVVLVGSPFCMTGVKMVAPGEARVIQLFGRYVGTIRQNGLRWVNPLTSARKISTRVRNNETSVMKVNDAYGNPIELAAVVVWKVEDTAQALFEVDDYRKFVATQAESAVRHIANEYPYDAHDEDALSLRGNADEITEKLSLELTARVRAAGVRIIEFRSRTRRRSPPRCSSASRPGRSPRPVSRSSRVRSAWSSKPWSGSANRASWTWTRSGRPPWSAT